MGEMRDFASLVVDAEGSGGASGSSVRAETFLEAAVREREFFFFPHEKKTRLSKLKKKLKISKQGISDVVASSYGGRNARVAREYAVRVTAGTMLPGRETVDALEAELLAGQSLQGELTSRECSEAIERKWGAAEGARRFPLFSTVRAVFDGVLPPGAVLRYRAAAAELAREAEERAAEAKEEEGGGGKRKKEEKKEKRGERNKREPAGV